MRFAIGAQVVVISIHKTGQVVEAARDGRYRVRVGAMVMACREDELAAAEAGQRRKRATRPESLNPRPDRGPLATPSDADRRRLGSIDLHGQNVEEALRAVEERLDAALRAGLDRLEIVHGRGSGRIKVAVHRLLREMSVVRRFEVAPENPGVTRVYL